MATSSISSLLHGQPVQYAATKQLPYRLLEDSRPATFLERGVIIPFTTPFLLGTRVRPAQRGKLDLVVPSPAGTRGSYVFSFGALREVCTPTLHDRSLADAIEKLNIVTPASIQRRARTVAREGLAGRATAEAAEAADRADTGQRTVTNFRLLLSLVEQTETPAEAATPAVRDTPAALESRAKRAIAREAVRTRTAPEAIVAALEGLADIYRDVGFQRNPTAARYQLQLLDLEALADELDGWGQASVDSEEAGAASLVAACARLTLQCGQSTIRQLVGLPGEMPSLIQTWLADAATLHELASRPGWLLDGWSTLVGIWRTAESRAQRAAAVREMAVLVPVMPREADSWLENDRARAETLHRTRSRFVFILEEWRTGRTLELTRRNEGIMRKVV